MKSYTDIKQSKVLSKILPLESADMYRVFENNAESRVYYGKAPTAYFVCEPCWSLAALLKALPKIYNLKPLLDLEENSIIYTGYIDVTADNPVDACVKMIIRLNELNLL